MRFKRKIFINLGPKFTGRVIALLLSAVICFGVYQIFLKTAPQVTDTPSEDTSATPTDNNITTDNIESDSEPSAPPPKEEEVYGIYSTKGSEELGGQISSSAALLCNNANNTVICRKSECESISAAPILGLTTALTALNILSSGTFSPSERAVCPASAIRLPCYSESSRILSVGQSLTIAELIKCMLCTSPEIFAYTLAIHISGSEQAFLTHMNDLLSALGTTSTTITSISDPSTQSTTAMDAAIIFRAAIENNTLLGLLSSRESFTVSASGSAWNTVTLCGRFYSECCTEGQAKADGILCGYYGEYGGKQYAFMLFEQLGTKYITVALNSNTAYADSLILLSRSVN